MSDPAERVFVEVFADYQRALQRANAFDFDDLIGQTVYLFRAFPAVADTYRRRFRHILVDEYQDTNHAQYALIHELTRAPGSTGTPHGDAGMMIFDAPAAEGGPRSRSWETPTSRSMPSAAPTSATSASSSATSRARRSCCSNRTIARRRTSSRRPTPSSATTSTGKTNGSGRMSARASPSSASPGTRNTTRRSSSPTRSRRCAGRGVAYSEMAVFYRTNSQSRALEEILIRSAVPYKIMGGTKFYERAEIKDALAYLVSVANPADDMAVRRILNKPRRGIGDVTESAIARFAADRGISFRAALADAGSLGLGPKLQSAIAQLDAVLAEATAVMLPPSGEVPPPTSVAEGSPSSSRSRATSMPCAPAATPRTRHGSRTSTNSWRSPASSPAITPRAPSSTSSPRWRSSPTLTISTTPPARSRS